MRRLTFAALALLLPTLLEADVGPKPRSTAAGFEVLGRDLKDLEVAMASEEVHLTLGREGQGETLGVDATFHMRNDGPEVAFEEGFPVGPINNMTGFSISIDGQPVKAELIDRKAGAGPDENHDLWYVWKATYKVGAESVRVVKYSIGISHFSEYRTTGYVLHTGAAWKGPIGKAVVTLRCAGKIAFDHITDLRPRRDAELKDGVCVWTRTNLEPTEADDIEISYNNAATWAERIAKLRAATATAWSPRQELVFTLEDAAARQARERMTEPELDDYLGALALAIAEAKEQDGKLVLPATEPEQIDLSNLPPDAAAAMRQAMAGRTSPRPYVQSDDGEVITRLFDRALAAAAAYPDSARAREVLASYARLGQAFLDGTLYADAKPLVVHRSVREPFTKAMQGRLERAAALAKR